MVCQKKEAPKRKCKICGKRCGCYVPYKDCFVQKKKPRYIKYMVKPSVWREDLQHYNCHRKRIFNATCYVDSKPLDMDLGFYLQRRQLRVDNMRTYDITRENQRMVKRIIEISRKGGDTDTFNAYAFMSTSQWKKNLWRMWAIDKENRRVHGIICDSEPYYPRKVHMLDWKLFVKRVGLSAKFPINIFKKTSIDEILKAEPTISGNLDKWSVRPQCYLDFKVKHGEYLGRIIVELYIDHVPVTVQNFMEIIRGENELTYENCPVHRIVKGRFLETGDITNGNGTGGFSVYGKTFDEENHKLMHTKAGVLSMVRLGGQQKNNSKFCITFMNMQEWDKKNVVFGKVVHGAEVLTKISNYGRVIGKPLRAVYISECGPMPDCTCT